MADYQHDKDKNLYEYHAVFASTLATYYNIRKELETSVNDIRVIENKRKELKAIIRSNLIYAIMLKRLDVENQDIPTDNEVTLITWLNEKEEEYNRLELRPNEVIEALFALMVRKQEVAGLTAFSEKNLTSRMNMLIAAVDKEGK